MNTEGEYFDGKSAQSITVNVQVINDELMIKGAGLEAVLYWSLEDVRDENVTPQGGSVFLSIEDGDPARLRIDDANFVSSLRIYCPRLNKGRGGSLRSWGPTIAASIAVILLTASVVWFGIPYISDPLSRLIPMETKQTIGESVEEQIVEGFAKDKAEEARICKAEGANKLLQRVIQEFESVSTMQDIEAFPVNIIVVNSKVANAFALPGRRIVLFSGLLDKAEHPNAVISVLAHEFAHVEERHPSRLFISNVGMAAILSVIFGDVSGGTIAAAIGQFALGAAYSRDFEEQADDRAIELMSEFQYDIRPLAVLLNEISKKIPKSELMSFFSTHPGMEERIEKIARTDLGSKSAFNKSEWAAVKTMCKGSI